MALQGNCPVVSGLLCSVKYLQDPFTHVVSCISAFSRLTMAHKMYMAHFVHHSALGVSLDVYNLWDFIEQYF